MYCQYCGHEVHDNAQICMNCGCATGNPSGSEANTTATPPASMNPEQAMDQPNISPKKGVPTLILLLLLGQFGAHRFYTGKIGSAIGMLILFLLGYAPVFWVYIKTVLNEHNLDYEITTENLIDMGVGMLILLAWFIWWIVDLANLCTSKFKDAQGRLVKLS